MARQEPVGSILRPSDSGSGDSEGSKFIRCVNGREPQIDEVWAFGENGVTYEVHPTARVDVGSRVVGEFSSNYITGIRRRIPLLNRFPLMDVLNIWAFLTYIELVGPFGLVISWLLVLVWETVVPPPIITGEFKLGDPMEVLPSYRFFPSVSCRIMSTGVRKTRTPLRATSVIITFKAIVWHACVVPLPAATPSEIHGSIGGMIIGRVWLINNLCGEFLFVVSV